ncbi:tetratricopeptide repeat protein [Seonamhaeicola sp. MEBiC1930]|uniref:tetratricopeptide repeat protein n=1 Tax=Seonamhaeicola sp. MEBiC01930 TaxID=2976768 RepID=UPI00324B9D19
MKKQFITALLLTAISFSFAQKKEVKALEKAVKANNFAEAKASLTQAEALLSAMDDKTKDKFYFLKGKTLYANGAGTMQDYDKALESFGNVKSAYATDITGLKEEIGNSLIKKGNDFYESKDYSNASKYFERVYEIKQDTMFLYYAAATAVNVKEYDRALVMYENLKDMGYTGITKEYFAISKETQKEEPFSSKELRNASVSAGTHSKPFEKNTASKKPEIVKNIALIYVTNGNNDKAITALKDARAESPDDVNLILTEANLYYKMDNMEEFKKALEIATSMDPKNPELQYNLGVINSESGQMEQARAHYEKAIELDPEYINAYINLSALILGQEGDLVEEMNGLGTSAADDKRYEELRAQRQALYKEAVPYLTKALDVDPENLSAAKTLMNIYSILGETDNYKSMQEMVEAIEASAN